MPYGCANNGHLTELPQYLYEAGWAAEGNVIACTQPRRVAATSVANRVATEVGSIIGDEVRTHPVTRIARSDRVAGRIHYPVRRRE